MNRSAFVLALTLSASLAGADPRPFQLGIGAGLGYLGLNDDVESDAAGTLIDQRTSYSFWGGDVFFDISDFFTLSTGIWSGVGKANVNVDPSILEATADNTLLLMDVSAVVKGPVTVGAFTFSPKVGFSEMLYLGGQLGGAAPDTATKQALSPFSFLVGADADYVFPNGVFLRLPLDFRVALNSRPPSSGYAGSYVASSGIAFSTGLTVGYKLLGHEKESPPPAPAVPASTAPDQTGNTENEQKPVSPHIRIAFGGGASTLTALDSQSMTNSGIDFVLGEWRSYAGVNGFLDISDYFSAYAGFQFGVGKATRSATGASDTNVDNQLIALEWGAEVKYPFRVSDTFSIAPKAGLVDIINLGGTIDSSAVSGTAEQQFYSPLSVTLGSDFNWDLANQLFLRVPFDVGIGLNSRLPSSYYSQLSATYSSSYAISIRIGVEVGYKL